MPWYNAVTKEHVPSPSDDNINKDELVYKPSIYAKEELPTWAEVYEEFYLGKQYFYDPNKDEEIDPYWKIPHKKFLIAVVCNQFNKMLYEDKMMYNICKELTREFCTPIIGLQFICRDSCNFNSDIFDHSFFETISTIYTFPLPTGKDNPFITNNHHRTDITSLNCKFYIVPVLKLNDPDISKPIVYPVHYTRDHFSEIMEIMIKEFKQYFTGDIGWKDSNGKLIEGDSGCRDCTGAGYCTK